jgi:ABC-type sugar transport system ATPase subunit
METYRTMATLPVAAGTLLTLSADQVRRRRHQLEPVDPQSGNPNQWGAGQYRATQLVQFKKGEVVGIAGELPKGHEALVERLEAKAAAKAAESAGMPDAAVKRKPSSRK